MIECKQRVKKLRRFDVETRQKNPRGELIHISSILKDKFTSKLPRRIDIIISTWILLSKSMKSRRTFHVEFRRRINSESTKMCPLGSVRRQFTLDWFNAWRSSIKKAFLKILQNSQENTFTKVSFLIKLQAKAKTYNFIKKDTLAVVFSDEFCEIIKNTFFIEYLRWLLLTLTSSISRQH